MAGLYSCADVAGELVPLSDDEEISSPTELPLSSADVVDSVKLFDRFRPILLSFIVFLYSKSSLVRSFLSLLPSIDSAGFDVNFRFILD